MKQQIIIIHGGTTYSSYQKYIDDLQTKNVILEKLKYKLEWKDSIASDLGDNYEVLTPRMPNGTNAKYKEWKIWFEKIIPLLDNGMIFIGHSLGGIFLAKYLSQNIIPQKIKAVILVSAPYEDTDYDEVCSFKPPVSLSKFNEQTKNIILIHSEDDPVVPVNQVKIYNKKLSNSRLMMFQANGHFKQLKFPELVDIIKSL
jgi:predicted alpha/beta hydrolase family esterase